MSNILKERFQKNFKKIIISFVVIIFFISWFNAIKNKPRIKVEQESFKLGTVVRLTLYGNNREKLENLMTETMSEIERYENLLSVNVEQSEISKINNSNGKDISVSSETREIISNSLGFAERTTGKFDPTIGAIVELWGIGSERANIPPKTEIEKLTPFVNYKKIQISGDKIAIGEKQKLDLGGVAKGWITDRLTEKIKEEGISSALIDLGGNIAVVGKAPKGRAWKIGLQHPSSPRGQYFAAVDAIDISIVTSGPYERFFEKDGVRYHHIFDPDIGFPSTSDLESVTIISKNSAEADALSTALFVMGRETSEDFLKLHKEVEAVLIVKDSKKVLITEGLRKNITLKEPSFEIEVIGDKK